jgi:hypothetical protein
MTGGPKNQARLRSYGHAKTAHSNAVTGLSRHGACQVDKICLVISNGVNEIGPINARIRHDGEIAYICSYFLSGNRSDTNTRNVQVGPLSGRTTL